MSSSYVTSALVADCETGTNDSSDRVVHTGETNVVVGRVVENRRAALILHDDCHFYCLTSKDGATGCQFPSHAVEIGATPVDTALKAFDNYAGVALRKAARSKNALAVMPKTAALINAAIKDMRVIGNRGNTLYYDVRIANVLICRLHSQQLGRASMDFASPRLLRNGTLHICWAKLGMQRQFFSHMTSRCCRPLSTTLHLAMPRQVQL